MNRSIHSEPSARRGVTAILVVAMIFVFIVAAALTVDVAYMHLVRTELRVATDSAAKAAAEALYRTESQSEARAAAKSVASLNSVGGRQLLLADADIQFGKVVRNNSGGWDFEAGGTPQNAVNVSGRVADDARTNAIPLFFAPAFGHDDFSASHSATAAQQDVEVCLALDRSGSMLFDMSGVDYVYPPDNPHLSSWTHWGTMWRNHLSAPNPEGSRWAVLSDAVDIFLTEAGSHDPPPRTALVTWGSDYTMPIPPRTQYTAVTHDVDLPSKSDSTPWSISSAGITSAIDDAGTMPMMGGTNMAAGLQGAITQLTGPNSSLLANKVIILLTDGRWTAGTDPVLEARTAAENNIVVHTVSMLATDTDTLIQISSITGGEFYSANNQTELRAVFQELARTLPIVLTD